MIAGWPIWDHLIDFCTINHLNWWYVVVQYIPIFMQWFVLCCVSLWLNKGQFKSHQPGLFHVLFLEQSHDYQHASESTLVMTSLNGNIFRVTGPLCGEFTGHRWIHGTKASDAKLWCFLDLHLNKRLSKQSGGWWFETPSGPLWRHRNVWWV